MSQRSHWSTFVFLSCVAMTGCSSSPKSERGPEHGGSGDTSMQVSRPATPARPSGNNTSANPAPAAAAAHNSGGTR